MNIRRTDVAWDPAVVRVEYLDEAGAPYYCAFLPRVRSFGPEGAGLLNRREISPGAGWDAVLTEALVGLIGLDRVIANLSPAERRELKQRLQE